MSRLAYPARSLTIAYSTMFAGVVRLPPFRHKIASCMRRLFYDGAQTVHETAARTQHRSMLVALSTRAWPGLVPNVRMFRYVSWILGLLTLASLVFTLFTYWDTDYGRTLLVRVDAAEKEITNLAIATTPATEAICADAAKAQTTGCVQWRMARKRAQEARDDMRDFAHCRGAFCGLHVFHWGVVLCGYGEMLGRKEDMSVPEKSIEQSVASVIAVFGNFILPMMFGYLGTLTGVFRIVRDKMRDSTLAPQDFVMVLISLPMGLVAGVAVGLFYSPSDATPTAVAGGGANLTLTVSGIAFLAGYAAEAFFMALDNLRARLFQATTPPIPPPPQRQ